MSCQRYRSAYELIHQAADILHNKDDLSPDEVKQNYQYLLQKMSNEKHLLGNLELGMSILSK